MAQAVECLPSKHKAWSSSPSTSNKKGKTDHLGTPKVYFVFAKERLLFL
jgi:hypothetical protein